MTESTRQKVPKVFISYSYDSEEHMDRVLALSDRLRKDGIDCNIDRYEQSPAQGWHRWMMDEIEKTDFVLMICTQQYLRRFRGNEKDGMGMGVTWEGSIITEELFSQEGENLKYIPILFAPRDVDFIPKILRSTSRYTLDSSKGYELLYSRLTDQHLTPKTNLGKLRTLPARDRKQFFTASDINSVEQKEPCNLPHKSYNDFVGRNKEVAKLLKWISSDYRPYMHVVNGIGGVGKTALVLEVAYQCWNAKKNNLNDPNIPIFDAIVFTSSKATNFVSTQSVTRPEKEPRLKDIFRLIADVLDEPTITQILEKEQIKKVYDVLAKQPTLLIVDNMETLSERERKSILSFLNNVPPPTQVIITTRDFLGFDGIVIKSLTQAESFDLLDRQASLKNIKININWKREVYKRFSGIPIALIYAVGKLSAGYSLDNLTDPKIDHQELGRFCFETSVTRIKNTVAYQLLISMTFFQDSPCRDALIHVAGLTDGHQDVIDGLAKLQQLSLIVEERGRYDILSITREHALLELGKNENTEFRRAARNRWYDWYLQFTQQYGGDDWNGWRSKYDRLDKEWGNIESVLNWYAEKEELTKVLQLWENVDNYVDLSRYWQKRRDWWAYLGKRFGSTKIKVKALSEKGWTLTLMGKESYEDADQYLNKAWDLRRDADKLIQATLANHLAVLSKVRGDYDQSHYWLNIEKELLNECQVTGPDNRKKRYQARNTYYRAEINYLQNKIELAKNGFNKAISLTEEIGWQRFKNYAKNWLAEIHIKEGHLELAEQELKSGLLVARTARERRRIALYRATYARLYEQLHLNAKNKNLIQESRRYIEKSKEYANQALVVFSKELMIAEKNEINDLLARIQNEH
jgi:hypothetical protein